MFILEVCIPPGVAAVFVEDAVSIDLALYMYIYIYMSMYINVFFLFIIVFCSSHKH